MLRLSRLSSPRLAQPLRLSNLVSPEKRPSIGGLFLFLIYIYLNIFRFFDIMIKQKNVKAGNKMIAFVNYLYSLIPGILGAFWNLLIAVVLFIVGHIVIKNLCRKIATRDYQGKVDAGLMRFLASVLKVGLYVLLVYIVATLVGIPTASFVALIGSAGLAIGLALQGSLSNFAGGVLIIVNKPFKVGDYIVVDGGPEGFVDAVDIFYTKMHTGDEKSIVVPNGMLSNSTIRNVAPNGERRIEHTIGIAYSADISLAKKTVLDVISRHDKLIRPEDTSVFVAATAESSVDLCFRCWAKAGDYFAESAAILEDVKLAFDAAGIEIPFSQLDVHIRKDNE